MYLLGVLYMVGLTVALPVLPEPPKLPYSIAAALQNQEIHSNMPEESVVKFYPAFIPPPPELPPFDYSTLRKLIAQRARSDGSVESESERWIEAENLKPIEEVPKVIEEESNPVESFKSEERGQPMEESKSAEQPITEDPIFVEEPISLEEPIYDEESKSVEEPKFEEQPIIVNEPKNEEEPITVEEYKSVEEPKPVEEPKSEEEPYRVEEPKPVEENKSAAEPQSLEEPSKEKPKEESETPLEDIPVVIQITIPTTSFFSNLISKFPSLSSFGLSWPFHIPSIFKGPRTIYPEYDLDDGIYFN